MRIRCCLLFAGALAACGDVRSMPDGGTPVLDAGAADAPAPPLDAAADAAADAPPPPPGQELTGGGGRISGSTFVMDVQLGHAFARSPTAGATFALEPSSPIEP